MTHESIVGLFLWKKMSLIKNPNGSWFGLPDLGITETIGKVLGTNTTSQGGSNILPDQNNTYGQDIQWNALQSYPSDSNTKSYATTTPVNTSGGSVPTNSDPNQPTGPNPQDAINAQQEALRNEIGSGYDAYLANLQNLLDSGFTEQKTAQEGIVNSQLQASTSSLDAQKAMGMNDLGADETQIQTGQVKTLKDVADNIRNLMQAGNTYLGSKGAGDSSAVNQYAYALTKMGSKQRGDVQSQTRSLLGEVANRKFKLNTMYNDQINQINSEAQQKILTIQNWFFDRQNEVRSQIAEGGLNKSKEMAALSSQYLNQATAQLQNLQAETSNKRSQLETWAMNNSQNIMELQSNLAKVADYQAQSQTYSPINNPFGYQQYTPQQTTYGGSSYSTDEDLFS